MRNLLYSAVLYLSGIAIVLYLRPALMFRKDGRWKEFGVQGIQGADTTYFPFWMFCIIWAVVAHALVHMFFTDDEGIVKAVVKATRSAKAAAGVALTSYVQDARTPAASAPALPEPTEEAKPGYYKLDDSLMRRKGVPRYIYVGDDKPSDMDEE